LVIENWRTPAFFMENTGSLSIVVDIELDGGDGYALATSHVALGPRETTTIPVSRIGQGEATVRFHVLSDGSGGTDRQAIVLETTLRHRTVWESLPWPTLFGGFIGLLVLLVAGLRLGVSRRRVSVRTRT
jgi:hypothetical protein